MITNFSFVDFELETNDQLDAHAEFEMDFEMDVEKEMDIEMAEDVKMEREEPKTLEHNMDISIVRLNLVEVFGVAHVLEKWTDRIDLFKKIDIKMLKKRSLNKTIGSCTERPNKNFKVDM